MDARVQSVMLECIARCLEPCVPCLCGCMTNHDGRVVWRGESGRRVLALTIDDVPRRGMTIAELHALLVLLEAHDAHATFFVIWEGAAERFAGDIAKMVAMLVGKGHEIGIHFDGRWGCTMSDAQIRQETSAAMLALKRIADVRPRYARMPGGFSRHSIVTRLEHEFQLRVVNGTAYPFDVDLCQCLSAKRLGRCAANLGRGGGRIAILHDRTDLHEKVEAFLAQAKRNRYRVVRLDALLDDIEVDDAAASRRLMPALLF